MWKQHEVRWRWFGRRVQHFAERWLVPALCPACQAAVAYVGELCQACREGLGSMDGLAHCPRCTGPIPCRGCGAVRGRIQRIRAVYDYRGTGGQLVRRAKLSRDRAALAFLGRAMARRLLRRDRAWRRLVVIPVPLAPHRLRERGFNQAAELAQWLVRRLAVPMLPRALRRVRETLPQGSPLVSSRARNLEGAFALGRGARRMMGARVLLVDDVLTSGVTLRECARVLLRDGHAAEVEAFVACSARR